MVHDTSLAIPYSTAVNVHSALTVSYKISFFRNTGYVYSCQAFSHSPLYPSLCVQLCFLVDQAFSSSPLFVLCPSCFISSPVSLFLFPSGSFRLLYSLLLSYRLSFLARSFFASSLPASSFVILRSRSFSLAYLSQLFSFAFRLCFSPFLRILFLFLAFNFSLALFLIYRR